MAGARNRTSSVKGCRQRCLYLCRQTDACVLLHSKEEERHIFSKLQVCVCGEECWQICYMSKSDERCVYLHTFTLCFVKNGASVSKLWYTSDKLLRGVVLSAASQANMAFSDMLKLYSRLCLQQRWFSIPSRTVIVAK